MAFLTNCLKLCVSLNQQKFPSKMPGLLQTRNGKMCLQLKLLLSHLLSRKGQCDSKRFQAIEAETERRRP